LGTHLHLASWILINELLTLGNPMHSGVANDTKKRHGWRKGAVTLRKLEVPGELEGPGGALPMWLDDSLGPGTFGMPHGSAIKEFMSPRGTTAGSTRMPHDGHDPPLSPQQGGIGEAGLTESEMRRARGAQLFSSKSAAQQKRLRDIHHGDLMLQKSERMLVPLQAASHGRRSR